MPETPPETPPDAPFDTTVTDALLSTTRAVRRRLDYDRPVDPAVILECIALAQQTPTASNDQNLIEFCRASIITKHQTGFARFTVPAWVGILSLLSILSAVFPNPAPRSTSHPVPSSSNAASSVVDFQAFIGLSPPRPEPSTGSAQIATRRKTSTKRSTSCSSL